MLQKTKIFKKDNVMYTLHPKGKYTLCLLVSTQNLGALHEKREWITTICSPLDIADIDIGKYARDS